MKIKTLSPGETFGYLKIIKFSHWKDHRQYYLCKCVCGSETIQMKRLFAERGKKSCGCRSFENRAKDYSGTVIAGLRCLRFIDIKAGKSRHEFICYCGNKFVATTTLIRNKSVQSCGCLRLETHTTHGLSNTKSYRIWHDIMRRCYDKRRRWYFRYGGKGITVCERWHNFENFYKDMGEKPKGLSIERVDNSKGYSKSNCIWADNFVQANNRSNNHNIYIYGVKYTLAQASRKFNIPYRSLMWKLKKGMSAEDAIAK